MNRVLLAVMVACATVAFTGCKKEETPGSKLDNMIKQGEKASQDAKKAADKAGGDLQKKLDDAMKK